LRLEFFPPAGEMPASVGVEGVSFSETRLQRERAGEDLGTGGPRRSDLSSDRAPEAPSGGGRLRRVPRSSLGILFVTVFIDLVGFGIVIPLLPLYAEQFGAGALTVTALVAVYSLMQFLFAPWWGQLSDRVGRRPVLLVGLFGSAASYLLFGLAGSLATLFVARMLAGVAGANVGVAQAYVADVTLPADRARGMGLIGAAFGLGFIFGPVIGGLLAPYGAGTPFLAAAGLALVNGLVALRALPESKPAMGGTRVIQAGIAARWRTLVQLGRSRRLVWSLFTAFLLLTLAFAALEATLSIWAARRWDFSPSEVAYLFAYLGVLVTLVQGGLVGRLARRFGERPLALAGMVAFALGLAGIAISPTLPALAVALALLAVGQGLAGPALSALISRAASAEDQGRVLGISQSLSALGRVIGPLWGGFAYARIGIGAPYLSGAAIVMLALGVLLAGFSAMGDDG
jgi:MFS transporter, DHA1 family, tetracycline resistance protein